MTAPNEHFTAADWSKSGGPSPISALRWEHEKRGPITVLRPIAAIKWQSSFGATEALNNAKEFARRWRRSE